MSDIVGELARVKGAFEQPTLTLLHQRQAPVVIAIFRSSFARDVRTIVAPRLHDQVEAYLSSHRSNSDRRIRKPPFGSLKQTGAFLAARQS